MKYKQYQRLEPNSNYPIFYATVSGIQRVRFIREAIDKDQMVVEVERISDTPVYLRKDGTITNYFSPKTNTKIKVGDKIIVDSKSFIPEYTKDEYADNTKLLFMLKRKRKINNTNF